MRKLVLYSLGIFHCFTSISNLAPSSSFNPKISEIETRTLIIRCPFTVHFNPLSSDGSGFFVIIRAQHFSVYPLKNWKLCFTPQNWQLSTHEGKLQTSNETSVLPDRRGINRTTTWFHGYNNVNMFWFTYLYCENIILSYWSQRDKNIYIKALIQATNMGQWYI